MRRFQNFKWKLAVFLICFSILKVSAQKPNIIFILADDAGYHDFGFQGSKTFKTPNLDMLASEGMVFNEAYTTDSVCGPSRAGFLTGMYQQRYGFEENNVPGYMSESSKLMGYDMGLPLGINTIADYLRQLGYKSIVLGKWHLGVADRYHPLNRGFDEFYGFRGGARSYWPLSLKATLEHPEARMEKGFGIFEEPKKYLTDAIADEASNFMERHKDAPFFMFVSFNGVHSPLQASEEDLSMIKELTGNRKKLAAMTLALDRACGVIFNKLKTLGLEKNTLIVFSNDNGGPDATETSNYPLSGCKSNFLVGGIRVPFIMKLPTVIEPGKHYKKSISMLDMLPTFINLAGGNASEIKELDGVDLMPFITKKNMKAPHERLFWKIENRGVVREGDWKLLRYPDRPAELYNIAEDITETNDLALQHPQKVREMYKTLFQWEAELERPLWQLKRIYEVNAVRRIDEKRTPILD